MTVLYGILVKGLLLHNKHSVKLLCLLGSTLFLFNGCVGTSVSRCSSTAPSRGYFCYQGYNFGRDLSVPYKQGVKDGCRTANGHFSKNYRLSANTKSYVKGWDKGRATCKLILPAEAQSGTMRTQYQQSIDEQKYYGN